MTEGAAKTLQPPGASRERFSFVAFPIHDWRKCEAEGFRTRDAHLIRELARRPDVECVLVVDRPISPVEIVALRRPWRIRSGHRVYRRGGATLTRVDDKIHVLDVMVGDLVRPLWLRRRWWAEVLGRATVQARIREAIAALNMRAYGLWLASPLAAPVAGRLGEDYLVFDATDDWLQHPQLNQAAREIEAGYDRMRERADLILTTSPALCRRLDRAAGHVHFLANGVPADFGSTRAAATPRDLRGLTRPLVGYAGKINERLDVALVSQLAQRLPEASFVFIGQLNAPRHFSRLRVHPNVHYLGDKPYTSLPDYLAAFDVCLIPHEVSALTASMNPLKFYEYLAAGSPVVSTPIAGIEEIDGWVTTASGASEFEKAVRQALARPPAAAFPVPAEWTWEFKAAQVVSILREALAGDPPGAQGTSQ